MGLFGKKKEKSDNGIIAGTNAMYYDGGLQGFSANDPVFVALTENALTVMKPVKGKESLTVSLDRSRILGMDVYTEEKQYMLKYRGDDSTTHKPSKLLGAAAEKSYFVINYTAKDGTQKRLDFWCPKLDAMKAMAMKNKLMKSATPGSYEI